MLVKDAGIPAKKTTKTYAGTGSPSLLELQSSKRISPTASEFLEMHNPKSSTYVGSTLLSPLKEKIHTTTKPSGTRPDSNESGMPNAIGTSNNNSSGTSSSANYSASVSGNASNVNGDLMSMYEQQQNRLAEQLQAQQAYYEQQLRAQQEARQQAAQNAYNSNMSALENAYAKRLAGLDSNLASTKDLLTSSYNNSRDSLNASAEKSLQEAYINRMMNEKSMRNQLNAQGITGGASESVIAGMLNNYANARNNIENNLANNVRTLREAYQKNLASALQNRNDALSAAEDTNLKYKMQLENDLRNNIIGSYNDLYSGLMNADANYYDNMAKLVYNQANNANELQNYAQKLLLNNNSDLQNYAERLRLSNLYNNSASTGDSYNTKNTSNGLSTAVLRVLQKYNAGTMTDEDYDSLTQEEKDQFIANM